MIFANGDEFGWNVSIVQIVVIVDRAEISFFLENGTAQ